MIEENEDKKSSPLPQAQINKTVDPKDVFNEFLLKKRIFKDKEVLSPSYVPDVILHRGEEIQKISSLLAPSLLLEQVSNLLIYGFSGTGKSLVTRYVARNLATTAIEKDVDVMPIYINCRLENNSTEYRLMASICNVFGIKAPVSGLAVDVLYERFIDALNSKPRSVILILDEIEKLVKHSGDEVIYSLLRLNEKLKRTKLSLIGISNDVDLKSYFDQRVMSSLSPVEIVFRPYNAMEIADILSIRARDAFFENAISEGVIQKCAALAAQEHGDIRKALNLLRLAGEAAQQAGEATITEAHLDRANDMLEQNITEEMVKSMTLQGKCVLYSIIQAAKPRNNGRIYSGEVYDNYSKLVGRLGVKRLTARRVADLIADMDYNSFITTRVRSNGRYGRVKELQLVIPQTAVMKIEKMLESDIERW